MAPVSPGTGQIYSERGGPSNLFRNRMGIIVKAIPLFSAGVNEPSITGKKSVFFINVSREMVQ